MLNEHSNKTLGKLLRKIDKHELNKLYTTTIRKLDLEINNLIL